MMLAVAEYPWMELFIGGLVALTNLVIAIATLVSVLRAERRSLANEQPQNGLLQSALEQAYLRGKSEGFDAGRGRREFPPTPPAGGNG